MTDNVTANAGSGGAVFATDDIGGVHYPVTKLAFGALDSATLVVATAGLPVAPQTASTWTVANGGTFAVQAAQSGAWNVTNISGTVSLPTGAATAAKQPALGTAGTASSDVITVQGIASMTPMLVDATGQGDVPITLGGEAVVLGAGSAAIGKLAANSGVDIGDVDVTSISAGANLIGDVGLSGARTSGGTTPYYNDGTCTETQVKASGGQIYWISAINVSASVVYLQMFNALAASVTPGTTTPTNEWPIPTQGDTNGAGVVISIPNGLAYGTGITFIISTAKGGGTAATADSCILNLGYA